MGFWSDIGSLFTGGLLGAASLIPGLAPFTAPAAAGMIGQGVSGMLTPDQKQGQQTPGLIRPTQSQKPAVNYLDTDYADAIRRLGG